MVYHIKTQLVETFAQDNNKIQVGVILQGELIKKEVITYKVCRPSS